MSCHHCEGIESEFGESTAAGELKRYRRRGPLRTTRMLLDALRREVGRWTAGDASATHASDAVTGGTSVLDVGGGIGIIHHELLRAAVADTATHVDASSSYLEAARSEAQRRGHDGRVRFMHGDFVDLAPELDAADIVTLDRVICCYPDMERLVGLSAGRARRLYGVVYPRDTWWLRLSFPLPNLWFRLRRSGFRVYLHNPTHIDAVIRAQGLEPAFHATTLVWEVAVYKRPTSPSPRPRPSPS